MAEEMSHGVAGAAGGVQQSSSVVNGHNAGRRTSSGIEVKRDFEVFVEETTDGFGRTSAEAYMHPMNTTAGVSVMRKM